MAPLLTAAKSEGACVSKLSACAPSTWPASAGNAGIGSANDAVPAVVDSSEPASDSTHSLQFGIPIAARSIGSGMPLHVARSKPSVR